MSGRAEASSVPGIDGVVRAPGVGHVGALVRERIWILTVWGAMLAWSVVLGSLVRRSYDNFGLARFDLGNMVQAVWSTAHGHPLEFTNGSTGEQMTRLGMHVDPILVLLTPFWVVWPSPLSLAYVQIAAVALGALPVFWLARRHLGSEKLGCVLALTYLAYPWLSWSAIGAVHPVTFAIPLFLYAIWFLDSDRLWAFAPFAVLAALTSEVMGLSVAALGLWYAFACGKRRAGLGIFVLGLGWTVFALYVVVHAFSSGSSVYYGFYDQIGGSPAGILRTTFSDPGAIVSTLSAGHVIALVLWLAVPLAGLFLLSPALAAVALPAFLVVGLSDFRSMTDPRYHDIAGLVPFLVAATILGISRIRPGRRGFAAVVVLALSVELAFVAGAWPRAIGKSPFASGRVGHSRNVTALAEAVSLVPTDAPVSASNDAGAHLSARRYYYSVPIVGRATWLVLDTRDPWVTSLDSPILTRHPERVRALARRISSSSEWRKIFDRGGVLVFRKTGTS